MTTAQKQVLLPSTLGRLAVPGFMFPRHLRLLQRAMLRLLTSPHHNRLIVSLPVRHGKSFYLSYLVPAWLLMTRPLSRVMLLTYGTNLSLEWGSRVLPTLAEWGPKLTGASVNPKAANAAAFRMSNNTGGFEGLGIGGALAGKGTDLLIADDLTKDQSEVLSPFQRMKLFSTFWSECMSRLEPGGKVVVVGSRRHPEDLQGQLLEMNEELEPDQRWELLHFPAITTADDGTETALWPQRYGLKALRDIRQSLLVSSRAWMWWSLYQGDPQSDPTLTEFPESYFRSIFYSGPRPSTPIRFRLMAFDPSCGSDKRMGDYAACLYGVFDKEGTFWIEDSFMETVPVEVAEDLAIGMMQRHRPDAFVIECNNFQEVIADNIIRKCDAQGLKAPIRKHTNTENKEARIRMSLSHLLAQGKVRFANTPANRIIVRELQQFPTGRTDDGADALEMMVRLADYLYEGPYGAPPDPIYHPLVT